MVFPYYVHISDSHPNNKVHTQTVIQSDGRGKHLLGICTRCTAELIELALYIMPKSLCLAISVGIEPLAHRRYSTAKCEGSSSWWSVR